MNYVTNAEETPFLKKALFPRLLHKCHAMTLKKTKNNQTNPCESTTEKRPNSKQKFEAELRGMDVSNGVNVKSKARPQRGKCHLVALRPCAPKGGATRTAIQPFSPDAKRSREKTPGYGFLTSNAFSMSATSLASSGSVRVPYFPITVPSRATRYFWKFHSTLPAISGLGWLVRYLYSGIWSSPPTETLANRSNVTLYFDVHVFLISASAPGS